jgi:hypothetical protein
MSVVQIMTHLQRLSLYESRIDDTQALLLGQTALSHSLTSLNICSSEFTSRYMLCIFISSLKSLSTLRVVNVSIVPDIRGVIFDDLQTWEPRIDALVPPLLTSYNYAHSPSRNSNKTGGEAILRWLAHQTKRPVPLERLHILDARDSLVTAGFFHHTLRSLSVHGE